MDLWFCVSDFSSLLVLRNKFPSLAKKDSRIHDFSSHACLMLRFLHNLSPILQRFMLCSKFRKHSRVELSLHSNKRNLKACPDPATLPVTLVKLFGKFMTSALESKQKISNGAIVLSQLSSYSKECYHLDVVGWLVLFPTCCTCIIPSFYILFWQRFVLFCAIPVIPKFSFNFLYFFHMIM